MATLPVQDPLPTPGPVLGGHGKEWITDGDIPTRMLDNRIHRAELRDRYYGLMQELRVLLPGVQVLVAFLLIAPFADRFGTLDAAGRALYGTSLVSGLLAVVAFVSPAAHHRIGSRHARSERLRHGIVCARAGLACLALALLSALLLVARLVFPAVGALVSVVVVASSMAMLWLVVPLRSRR
jgi:Family of unknown function (DUF6328)